MISHDPAVDAVDLDDVIQVVHSVPFRDFFLSQIFNKGHTFPLYLLKYQNCDLAVIHNLFMQWNDDD